MTPTVTITTCSPWEWEATVAYPDGIAYRRRGTLFAVLAWVRSIATAIAPA